MKGPLRILHVVHTLGREGMLGGGIRVPVEIVKFLNRRAAGSAQLCVLGMDDPNWHLYGLQEKPIFLGVRENSARITDFLLCVYRLIRVLHRIQPTLIHSHLRLSDFVVGVACRTTGLCHVAHINDTRSWMTSPRPIDRARRWFYRRLLDRPTTRFIACARTVRNHVITHLRLTPERIDVVYNGIDPLPFSAPTRRQPESGILTFGSAGRLQPEKGYDVLIQAMGRIKKQGLSARLRIAGDGSRIDRYRELAAKEGVADEVEFCGRLTDMPPFYQSIDAYVLASTGTEGLPLSILEAMASGLPVIATDVAGAAEALRHEQEGLLIPPGDVEALRGALQRLIEDDNLRMSLSKRARERVQQIFTTEAMGAGTLATYDRLLTSQCIA